MSLQDGYKVAESNSALFRSLAEKLREQYAKSTGSPHLGLSKIDVLLQSPHQALSERISADKRLRGDKVLIAKDQAYC
jgi:hypothetical protein